RIFLQATRVCAASGDCLALHSFPTRRSSDLVSALHVLTVGVISTMMLAVMTRATRGHTGRALTASGLTMASYLCLFAAALARPLDRKSTRLNSSHVKISYAVFCLKKKKKVRE